MTVGRSPVGPVATLAAAPVDGSPDGQVDGPLHGPQHGVLDAAVPPVRLGAPAPAEAPVAPDRVEEPVADEEQTTDRPWVVVVWNDPVNLMSYVVFVFQKLFGFSREKATRLMLQVHHEGRAAVTHGPREKAEADVARLHAHGLWATMQRDS